MTEKDFDKGFICTCCGQFCKTYSRKLGSSMAMVLILIARAKKTNFFHIENWLKEIGRSELRADYHKLRFWNLIEKKIEAREDGSGRNGYYKITGRGIMFAENKLTVPEKAIVFNNKFLRFDGDDINILTALGKRFSYSELMEGDKPQTAKTTKQDIRSHLLTQQDLFT